MPYDWIPTHFDGVDLAVSPFDFCRFDQENGPARMQEFEIVESAIVDLGSRFVRGQPQPGDWEVHNFMSGTEEAQLAAMRKVWSPDRGLSFLRANDGTSPTPVNYRVAGFCRGFDRLGANHWLSRLWVQDVVWEENALNTSATQNPTVNPHTFVVTNNGDRLARPVVTFQGLNTTGNPAFDFTIAHRAWVANRCPFPLVDYWVNVLTFNHNALFIVAGVTRLVNLGGGITATQTSIPYDTTAGSWPAAGFARIDSEQFYYASYDGTNFLNCVRGIGGSVAATHADNATITRSDVLQNGEDIRVFDDGEEIESHVAGLTTSTCRVWAPFSMPARRKLHIAEAWTTGAPADAGEALLDWWSFAGDNLVADLPVDGMIVVRGGSDELVAYNGLDVRTNKIRNINRASWYTTTTAHNAGEVAYLVGHPHVMVTMGRRSISGTGAWPAGSVTPAPPPRAPERRPAFALGNSDNTQWRWGDTVFDPETCIFDPDSPDRPHSFVPVDEVPAKDLNDATGLRQESSIARAGWQDSDPVAGKPIRPRLSLYVPTGIEAVASGIVYDAQQRRNVRLRILGRDATGFEIELADRQDVDEALVTGQTITPTKVLHELILNAVRAATTGYHIDTTSPSTTRIGSTLGSEFIGTLFTLTRATRFKSVQLAMQKGGAGDGFSYEVYIVEDPGGADPFAGKAIAQMRHSSAGTGPAFPGASLSTSYTIDEYRNDLSPTFVLPAGSYWIVGETNTLAGGDVGLDVFQKSGFGARAVKKNQAGTITEEDPFFFRLVHAAGGPVQLESDLIQTAAEAYLDNLIVQLNDAAADPWVPLVGSFQAATYHMNGRLSNDANGKGFDLDYWTQLISQGDTPTITVDTERRTVTYQQGNWVREIAGALTPIDDADWLPMEPAANTLRYVELAPDLNLVVTHRGKRG